MAVSDMEDPEMTPPLPRLTAALFIIMLCLPGLFGLLGYDRMEKFSENRTLASFPRKELQRLAYREFAHKLDSFVSDHFGFRPALIFAVNKLKLALKATPASSVILGQQGWLYNSSGAWDYDEYLGIVPPNTAALRSWRLILQARAKAVRAAGTYFLMVVPPQKEAVYPEFLPNWLQRVGDQTRIRQFQEAMKSSGVDVLDLTPAMLAAKRKHQTLYYRADTHWNRLGALWGAKAVIDHLHAKDRRIPPFRKGDYTIAPYMTDTKPDGTQMDLRVRLGMPPQAEQDFMVERKGGWTTTETISHRGHVDIYTYTKNDPSLPVLLVYTDSYGFGLHRFLAEYFRRAVFINWWPASNNIMDRFPLEWIKKERPDFVINLRFERGILGPINPIIEQEGR
jgi:hypothetical protein